MAHGVVIRAACAIGASFSVSARHHSLALLTPAGRSPAGGGKGSVLPLPVVLYFVFLSGGDEYDRCYGFEAIPQVDGHDKQPI